MAYIKYKELTKYFDFHGEIDTKDLPKYVLDYIGTDETIISGYRTRRDKGIFTDQKMLLFDLAPIGFKKKIHIIPYRSISSGAIAFYHYKASMEFSLDSGYQMRLVFVNLTPAGKTNLRLLYSSIMSEIMKKWH